MGNDTSSNEFHDELRQLRVRLTELWDHISRQNVELHGGKVESEFGEKSGTTFVITLPVNTGKARKAMALAGWRRN